MILACFRTTDVWHSSLVWHPYLGCISKLSRIKTCSWTWTDAMSPFQLWVKRTGSESMQPRSKFWPSQPGAMGSADLSLLLFHAEIPLMLWPHRRATFSAKSTPVKHWHSAGHRETARWVWAVAPGFHVSCHWTLHASSTGRSQLWVLGLAQTWKSLVFGPWRAYIQDFTGKTHKISSRRRHLSGPGLLYVEGENGREGTLQHNVSPSLDVGWNAITDRRKEWLVIPLANMAKWSSPFINRPGYASHKNRVASKLKFFEFEFLLHPTECEKRIVLYMDFV